MASATTCVFYFIRLIRCFTAAISTFRILRQFKFYGCKFTATVKGAQGYARSWKSINESQEYKRGFFHFSSDKGHKTKKKVVEINDRDYQEIWFSLGFPGR